METALAAFSSVWLLDVFGYCLNRFHGDRSRAQLVNICARVVPASALFACVRPENPMLLVGVIAASLGCCYISGHAKNGCVVTRALRISILSALAPVAIAICMASLDIPRVVSSSGCGEGWRRGPLVRRLAILGASWG